MPRYAPWVAPAPTGTSASFAGNPKTSLALSTPPAIGPVTPRLAILKALSRGLKVRVRARGSYPTFNTPAPIA